MSSNTNMNVIVFLCGMFIGCVILLGVIVSAKFLLYPGTVKIDGEAIMSDLNPCQKNEVIDQLLALSNDPSSSVVIRNRDKLVIMKSDCKMLNGTCYCSGK